MEKEKLLQIYESVHGRYILGSLSFVLFITIRRQFEMNKIQQEDIFAGTIYNSSFNNAILSLTNLIRKDNGEINLHYLINMMKQSEIAFDKATYQQFLVFVNQYETACSTIMETVDQMFVLRDKMISHIDKKQITNPSFFEEKLTATIGDLESAYSIVYKAVLEIGGFLGLSKTSIEDTITILHFSIKKRALEIFP